jgi:hypothetical protein
MSVVHEIATEEAVTLEAWTFVITGEFAVFTVTAAWLVTVPLALVAVRV